MHPDESPVRRLSPKPRRPNEFPRFRAPLLVALLLSVPIRAQTFTLSVAASEFTAGDSTAPWTYDSKAFRRYSTVAAGGFVAVAHPPEGVSVTSATLYGCNTSPTAPLAFAVAVTDAFGNNASLLGTGVIPPNSGCTSVDLVKNPPFVPDNKNNILAVSVVTGAGDATTSFSKVDFNLVKDDFPFNPTPAFGDVPADHPFFKYIQKMTQLGVTSGCGSGNYCPDAPVTRGQMAVFLVRAYLYGSLLPH